MKIPKKDFEKLSREAISLANRLPGDMPAREKYELILEGNIEQYFLGRKLTNHKEWS